MRSVSRRMVELTALLVVLLVAAHVSPLAGQGLSEEEVSRGQRMLKRIKEELERHYYDSTFHGIDLEASYRRTDSAIVAAENLPAMLAAIAQFMGDLDDSHTNFSPPSVLQSVQYGFSWTMVGEKCLVTSVTKGMDAEKQGLAPGDRIVSISGIAPTRKNDSMIKYVFYSLSPVPGLGLVVESPDGEVRNLTVESKIDVGPTVIDYTNLAEWRRRSEAYEEAVLRGRRRRFEFRTFGDSVMVWRYSAFVYGDEPRIDEMMKRARKHKILIVDLRDNSGGAVVTLERLIGHFFDRSVTVATFHRRNEVLAFRAEPAKKEPFKGDLYVIINSNSASASELFARTMQVEGRGMVAGDRSAGAVMVSIFHPQELGSIFQERIITYGLSITDADVVMSDGGRLEKVGVVPNIGGLPTAEDIAEGRDPVLSAVLDLVGVRVSPEEAGKLFK